jgi:hypothetical protein
VRSLILSPIKHNIFIIENGLSTLFAGKVISKDQTNGNQERAENKLVLKIN